MGRGWQDLRLTAIFFSAWSVINIEASKLEILKADHCKRLLAHERDPKALAEGVDVAASIYTSDSLHV